MARKRKSNERLSSVVKESTSEAAFALLLENTKFLLPNDIGVILVLNTESAQFGGLSQRQRKDEDKGQIIEKIAGDYIQALVTADMLDEDALGFIPTAETLDDMSDFSILVKAPYSWATVQFDRFAGVLAVDLVGPATFQEAVDISEGKLSLREVMPTIWDFALSVGSSDDFLDDDATADDIVFSDSVDEVVFDEADSEMSMLSQITDDDGTLDDMDTGSIAISEAIASGEIPVVAPTTSEIDEVQFGFDDDDDDSDVIFGDDGFSDDEWGDQVTLDPIPEVEVADSSTIEVVEDDPAERYNHYVDVNKDREYGTEEIRETIVRRFQPEDLDLQVNITFFDETFASPAPHFDYTPSGSEWLDTQVAVLIEQANADLEQHHWNNLSELRERYISMSSRVGDKVVQQMSLTAEGSDFANLMKVAAEDYRQGREKSELEVAQKREEITKRFEKDAEAQATAAAQDARARFENQNRATRDRLLSEAGAGVERKLDERFESDKTQIKEIRNSEAAHRFDLALTRIIDILVIAREGQREGEARLMESWNNKINEFMAENRRNDITRIEALAEQQARRDQVEEMRKKFLAEAEDERVKAQIRVREMEGELAKARSKAVMDLQARDESWASVLASANAKVEQANGLSQTLQQNLSSVRDVVESQFQVKVADLERDKAQLKDQLNSDAKQFSRVRSIIIMVFVLITVLAVLIGVIGGFFVGSNFKTSTGADSETALVKIDQLTEYEILSVL